MIDPRDADEVQVAGRTACLPFRCQENYRLRTGDPKEVLAVRRDRPAAFSLEVACTENKKSYDVAFRCDDMVSLTAVKEWRKVGP